MRNASLPQHKIAGDLITPRIIRSLFSCNSANPSLKKSRLKLCFNQLMNLKRLRNNSGVTAGTVETHEQYHVMSANHSNNNKIYKVHMRR